MMAIGAISALAGCAIYADAGPGLPPDREADLMVEKGHRPNNREVKA